jgi:hypothetical protein
LQLGINSNVIHDHVLRAKQKEAGEPTAAGDKLYGEEKRLSKLTHKGIKLLINFCYIEGHQSSILV